MRPVSEHGIEERYLANGFHELQNNSVVFLASLAPAVEGIGSRKLDKNVCSKVLSSIINDCDTGKLISARRSPLCIAVL
jgi:hypothetical protein